MSQMFYEILVKKIQRVCNIFVIAVTLVASSCSSKEYFKVRDLEGNWKVVKWEVPSIGYLREDRMEMTFESTGHYETQFMEEFDKGVYKIKKDTLYLNAASNRAQKLKILKLNFDTLAFQVFRNNTIEQVLLFKK